MMVPLEYRSAIVDRAQEIMTRLALDDLHVTLDRRRISPPCAVLDRPAMSPAGQISVGSSRAVEWTLYLVVKGADDFTAWRSLDQMSSIIFDIWGAAIDSCEPTTFEVNEQTSHPAYQIKFQEIV